MKLCPQCEFLYEDEQVFCDMDGEGLVHDSRAEVFSEPTPAAASASPKHSRPRLMIGAVLAGFFLSAVLSFAYYAATRAVDFDRVSPGRKPELSQQITPTSVDNSSAQPAASPSQSQTDTASDSPSPSTNELASPSASPSGRAHSLAKASDNASSTGDTRLMISKRVAPLPRLNPLPQLPSAQRLPDAKATAALPVTATSGKQKPPNETRTGTSQKSVIVEVKPTNVTKRSKVGAFFKKTGRMLAKPFKQ